MHRYFLTTHGTAPLPLHTTEHGKPDIVYLGIHKREITKTVTFSQAIITSLQQFSDGAVNQLHQKTASAQTDLSLRKHTSLYWMCQGKIFISGLLPIS